MRRLSILVTLFAAVALVGCSSTSTTCDLKKVADQNGMANITTGDGTFADYQATGHHTAFELGLALGFPFVGKWMEVVGAQTNDEQMDGLAKEAKSLGANAMINVSPPGGWFFPILIIFGPYVDTAEGTGIKLK